MDQKTEDKISELQQDVQWAARAWILTCESEGIKIIIREAYRSYEDQMIAWGRYKRGEIAAAAYPGTSLHQIGLAVDITVIGGTLKRVLEIASQWGIYQPLPRTDPYHLQLDRVCAPQASILFGGFSSLTQYLTALLGAANKPQTPSRMGMIRRTIDRIKKMV